MVEREKWSKAMEAMGDALAEMERFDQLGPPEEPSTPALRAQWAALNIQRMMRARQDLLGLARGMAPAPADELPGAAEHAAALAKERSLAYVKAWLGERGVPWREMERPLPEWGGLSWAQLLPIDALNEG